MFGVDVGRSMGGRPLLLAVLGPPLRLPPLLALARESVMLAFTDDPGECAVADVVLLSDPPVGDVHEVREHALDTPLVVVVPRGASARRTARLREAGADLCLPDPEAADLVRHLACLRAAAGTTLPLQGEA